ncbi:uncharacterized protein RSE6_14057 [Rhynchosporium secalis]|uniref:Uncharacterized protein n=1 Tax=Rhynchosporium secalis TaxID=38038 RepID=A0A1E1MUD9_RHYSE|nr:uncharacterized protein RSE6_14057 [Rhynchosporium secalis]
MNPSPEWIYTSPNGPTWDTPPSSLPAPIDLDSQELAKDFSKFILAAPSDTVIAAIRDPSTAILLESLLEGKCSTHIIIKIDSASDTDPIAVIEILKTKYYISALDIVIVRAGISEAAPSPVASMPLTGIQIHLQINGIALVFWCQAVFPLLE